MPIGDKSKHSDVNVTSRSTRNVRPSCKKIFKFIKCVSVRMATENSVSDDNRTAVGQVKSVRRVPVSRSTMVRLDYHIHSNLCVDIVQSYLCRPIAS